jgi:hypothetical protein
MGSPIPAKCFLVIHYVIISNFVGKTQIFLEKKVFSKIQDGGLK